jgi:hypothetical protein
MSRFRCELSLRSCASKETIARVQKVLEVFALPTDPPGNLVRNPDFKLRWISPHSPDHWTAMTSKQLPKGWESTNIRVSSNSVYRAGAADLKPGNRLGVRWRQHHASPTAVTNEIWTAVSAERELTPPAGAAYAQVLVVTDQPLRNAVRRVWFAPARRD